MKTLIRTNSNIQIRKTEWISSIYKTLTQVNQSFLKFSHFMYEVSFSLLDNRRAKIWISEHENKYEETRRYEEDFKYNPPGIF